MKYINRSPLIRLVTEQKETDRFHLQTTDLCTKMIYRPLYRHTYGIAVIYFRSAKDIKFADFSHNYSMFHSLNNDPDAVIPVLEETFFEVDPLDRHQHSSLCFKEYQAFYTELYEQMCSFLHKQGYSFLITLLSREEEKELIFFGSWPFILRNASHSIKTFAEFPAKPPSEKLTYNFSITL